MMYEDKKHGAKNFPIAIYKSVCDGGFNLHPHMHYEFEFLVVTKGRGLLHINGVEYKVSAGDAVFINSRSIHIGTKSDSELAEFYAVVFSPEIFGMFGNDAIINKYIIPVIENTMKIHTIYKKECNWQNDVLRLLNKIYKQSSNCMELKIKALLFEIWSICCEHAEYLADNIINKKIAEIKEVIDYINLEYAQPLTLTELALRFNMSNSHFCRWFSEVMYVTPFEYLIQIRINNSCSMLLNNNKAISDIANECGFNDSSYFSKKFKELVGCTPRKYRVNN